MPVEANQLAVAKLRAKTPVGSVLNTAEWSEVPIALRDRAFFSAEVEKLRLLQRMQDRIQGAVELLRRPGEGRDGGEGAYQTREKFVAEMQKLARDEGLDPRNRDETAARSGTLRDITSERRLRLIYDVQTESAAEYARWKAEQDPDVMAAFPAQEFVRVKSVKKPRHNWPERWAKAGGKVINGRMVALKSDPVWRKLSRFGTPYPPFDFGSGMGLRDVRRKDAEALGLIKPGEPVKTDGKTAEEGFNDDLQASIADLNPEYRRLLQQTFGEQIEFEGDTAFWKPRKVEQAQPIDRAQTPAPRVEPGAGLGDEPERPTAEEAESLQLPFERATIYDNAGQPQLTRDADPAAPGRVAIEPEEYPLLKDATFAHNHVGAGGPSAQDFAFAQEHDVAELRVIATDEENRPILHRLIRPPAGWRQRFPEAEAAWRAAALPVARELQAEVAAGRLTEAQMNATFEQRVLERLVAERPELAQYQRIAL